MTARRIRPSRSRLVGAGIVLAAALTATSATGASGLWSAEATGSLSVQGAEFGASSSTPTVLGSSYDGVGPYTGAVEILYPVSATSGSMPWTAAKVEVTGTGAVGATGATTSVTGYGVTSTGSCAGVSYGGGGTSMQLTALNSLANGGGRGVCVRLGITGLTAASNNTFATIGLTVTAALGPSSVDGTGWSASAPSRSVNVYMPAVPEPVSGVECIQIDESFAVVTVDPARNGPARQVVGSPTGQVIDVFHNTGAISELYIDVVLLSGVTSGTHTIYVVGPDNAVWGSYVVSYYPDAGSSGFVACGEVN